MKFLSRISQRSIFHSLIENRFLYACRFNPTTWLKYILFLLTIYLLSTIFGLQHYLWSEKSFENEYHLKMTRIDITKIDAEHPEETLGSPKYIIDNKFIISNKYLCNYGNSTNFIRPYLLILVKSAIQNWKARKAIRMTWGKKDFLEKNNIKLAFVLGMFLLN